jgi:predicted dehydrogenase
MLKKSEKQKITKDSPILLIGFGSIGQRHYRNLKELGYGNIAVHDLDKEKLKAAGVRIVEKLTDAVFAEFPIVFICNPSHLHVSTALRAAKAGCHLFIEKPLALSVLHLKELSGVVRKKRITAMVACNYRFHPGFQFLRKIIESQKLGKPLLVHTVIGHDLALSRAGVDYRKTYVADLKKGGGVIMDSGSHAIDYLTALFGKVKRGNAAYGNISTLEIRSEDYATAQLEFVSGVRGTLVLDYFSKPKRHSVEVQCSKGMVRWDFPNNAVEWYDASSGEMRREHFYQDASKEIARNEMYLKEIAYFFDVILSAKKPVSDIAHATLVTKTLCELKKR